MPLDLSDRERLKLGRLVDASLTKSGELVASVASQSGLAIAFIESIANADEDLVIRMDELDKLAPFVYRPDRWDGNRPNLSESLLQSGAELLAAIRNGNGAKANTKLVESLAEIIQTLTVEEKDLLNRKINLNIEIQQRPFYEVASTEERAKAFQEWAESHRLDTPILSDEAISRESIYGDRW